MASGGEKKSDEVMLTSSQQAYTLCHKPYRHDERSISEFLVEIRDAVREVARMGISGCRKKDWMSSDLAGEGRHGWESGRKGDARYERDSSSFLV